MTGDAPHPDTASAPRAGGRGRTGRRPGNPDTRGHILDVALATFLRTGYEQTSVRAIARAAGVDPALIHRYFGTKKDLLLAAVQMHIDPTSVVDAIAAGGTEHLGARIVYVVTGIWEQRLGPTWIASMHTNPALMRVMIGFLNPIIVDAARRLRNLSPAEARLRGSLVEVIMSGLAMTRYVAALDAVAELSREDLAAILGPAIDHVMTCEPPAGHGRHLPP